MASFGALLRAGEFVDTSVCMDCLMGIANGEWPDTDYDVDWTADRDSEADATLREFDVTLGHIHRGAWANTGCFHAGDDCSDDDCDCERTEFAWSRCGVCGTGLAGSRHDVIMVRWSRLD